MEKNLDHKLIEEKRNAKWIERRFFSKHDKNKKPFTIILPPPNVTGKLHIGHALDGYIQDAVIRYKKLHGYDVLFLPGKDHAGIATQAVVEKQLLENKKLTRYDIGREALIEEIWKWKDEYSNNITQQWGKLGLALDYESERFTLDSQANEAVLKIFVQMYQEGLIYRDNKAINWDPKLQTALSNIEVINKETEQKMYYIKYPIKDSDEYLEIATTRVETLYSDVAIAINPEDKRVNDLINKIIVHPLTKKEIPIVKSESIDPNFGSGLMKVSAHAMDDIEIIKNYKLDLVESIDKNGLMNENAAEFKGLDRFKAREEIAKKLKAEGYLIKEEKVISNVGYSERSKEAIEVLVQPQWFVKMEKLAKDILNHLDSEDKVEIIPVRFESTLRQWMENAHDWTISRQIWWGHRIPAWYKDDQIKVQIESPGQGWSQDNDVLDTWFSSALSPFVFLGWPQSNEKLNHYYPTDLLVTGYDIIFFWVSRMYFQGLHFMHKKPFKQVLLHGLVRDSQGRKMSKSLGNGIDPIAVIDQYGSDVLKMSLIFNSTPGQDINYGDEKIQMARLFINKFWNIARLINNFERTEIDFNTKNLDEYDFWIINKFNEFKNNVDEAMKKYEFTIIFKHIQDFIINDFSSWYLEFLKFKNNANLIHHLFKQMLIVLHPYMPFLTDYLFETMYEDELLEKQVDDLIKVSDIKENNVKFIISLITTLRKYREDKKISKSQTLYFYLDNNQLSENDLLIINKLTNFEFKENHDLSLKVLNQEIYIKLDENAAKAELEELKKLIEKCKFEIEFNSRFISNPDFMAKANPKTIQDKKDKIAEFSEQLAFYEEQIKNTKKKSSN
ncbi:valine--tRNA ligase [Mycoplasma struthionis]|uniref:Valine--tRNA ligase n=2 Tax=Mycoplasma struthionis TaxID=538220 RepID=A0A502MIW6_9MOLU|nr:valine--tRNA ligase [Mycoplasma struthionis]